jgi:thioredoxin-like negative regulator of GroEL
MIKILKFSMENCGPCKLLAHTIQNSQYRNVVEEIDADAEVDLCIKYGIRTVPTVLVLHSGIVVGRKIGNMTLEAFDEFILSSAVE